MTLRLTQTLVFLLVLVGCASFRSGKLTPITDWPPESHGTKRPIAVQITGSLEFNGRPQGRPLQGTLERWYQQAVTAYQDSGLFSKVKGKPEGEDLTAEITIEYKVRASRIWMFISAWTLHLLPSRATQDFILTTHYRDGAGATLATITKQERVSLWHQFFLLFAFKSRPTEVPLQVLYDLNRACILEAMAQGFLRQPS